MLESGLRWRSALVSRRGLRGVVAVQLTAPLRQVIVNKFVQSAFRSRKSGVK